VNRAVALLCLLAGCNTWGVAVVDREVKASHPADGITLVAADVSVEGEVSARGGGSAIDATAAVEAWIAPGDSAALLDRVRIAMDAAGSQLAVAPDLKGAGTEQIVLTDLELLLADPLAVDLAVSHGDVSVEDLAGPVRIDAPDSEVTLVETGPVVVTAREATATIGGGGSIATSGSGAVTVTVLGSDFDELEVTTETGPVAIHLPPDRGWDIELATSGEGTAMVSLGGLSCGTSGDPCVSIRFGEGGPLIHVESSGGTITVDDLR
jgi:hypothetical protein